MKQQLPTWIIKDNVSQLLDNLAKSDISPLDFATASIHLETIDEAADVLRETLSEVNKQASQENADNSAKPAPF